MNESDKFQRYKELLRAWSSSINLVGPEVLRNLDAHCGEAIEAADHLVPSGIVLDVGSGGGLPGVPMAIRAPGAEYHFVEADQKKWAFLKFVVRECALNAVVHGDRLDRVVDRLDPSLQFSLVTSRAVGHHASWLPHVRDRMPMNARVALFEGRDRVPAMPGFVLDHAVPLGRGESNFLVVLRRL